MMKLSISIDVPDLQAGEDFYTQVLDCRKVRDQGRMVVLAAENCEIYLLEKAAGTKPLESSSVVRAYDRHWTPIHLDFLCENVDELVTKIAEHGGSHEGGASGEWGSIAHCADPFGNGFCLINE